MSLDERYDLFGDPSDRLVVEAVWLFHEDNGDWPLWSEAVDLLADWQELSSDEAEARVLGAVSDGEVLATLRGGGLAWGLGLSADTAGRITRRYLDLTMPRRDKEETF